MTPTTIKTSDIDVMAICKKIMENGKVETFRPFSNKSGNFQVKKYAKTIVNGYEERLFESCRKVSKTTAENKKVYNLLCYLKSLNDSGKLSKGYEIGFNKLVSMFISWTDNRYTFNLRDENDLRTIGYAVAVASLKGFLPCGLMYQIIKNRDDVNVVRVVDNMSGFYTWTTKKQLSESEKIEESKKAVKKQLENLYNLTKGFSNSEKLEILKDLKKLLDVQTVGKVTKKNVA